MTELQGWVAIAVSVSSILLLVWRMSAGFSGLKGEIQGLRMQMQYLGKQTEVLENRLNSHSQDLKNFSTRIAGLEVTCRLQHLKGGPHESKS